MTHLWLLLFWSFWIKSEAQGFGMNLIKVPDDDRGQIICTTALLGKYFHSGESLSGFVLHMSISSASAHVQQSLLQSLHTNDKCPWTLVVKEARKDYDSLAAAQFIMHEKPQCYFIVIENMEDEDMDEIFENWKSNLNWNPLAQFVVYLSAVEETEEEMTDIMIEILLNFMNKKIYNVNVIGQSEESTYYYGKTVFPYHPDNNCGNRVISIETLDICDYQEGDKEEAEEEEDEEEVIEADEGGEAPDEGEGGEEQEEIAEEEQEQKDKEKNTSQEATDIVVETTEGQNPNYSNEDNNKFTESVAKEPTSTIAYTQNDDELSTLATTSFSAPTTTPSDVGQNTNYSNEDTKKFTESVAEERTSTIAHTEFEAEEHTSTIAYTQNDYEQSSLATSSFPAETTTLSDAEFIEDSKEARIDYQSQPLTQSTNQSIYPRLYIEELYRALFLDKFPKDLSGCPLVAAYRPWEPYIFNEALVNSENIDTPTADAGGSNDTTTNVNSYGGGNKDDANDNDDEDYVVYGEQPDTESEADVQNAGEEVRLNGIEYKMIQTIGERLHISIEMQVENTNLYHLFQQLIDGDIEMVVGGIDEDPSISQFVSSTIPYHQDDLTWCVAKAQNAYNLFNFMATFESGAWILTLFFILTASLNILMSKKLLKLHIDILKSYFSINIYVMGIILSQAINLKPIPTCLKIAFGATFFMGLMFSNVYQSFLVSTLTTPKSSYQISHLQEIYQNRMHIMGSVDNVRHLNKEGEIYRYVREQFQMCYNIEECLQRTASDAKLAVAVSRHYSFYNPRIPRDRLYCFDRNENIYVYLVTMLMPKKFHLLHKINPVIQHIIESGHMQKWARDIDMRRKITEEIQRAREEPFKSLTLAQSGGGFIFAGILLLFSSWVFAWEHFVYWLVVKRKTRLKLAKVIHRKFV